MGFFFIIIITSKHFQTVDNNKTPIFFSIASSLKHVIYLFMCKKQSGPWLPNQLRSFINFFCHVNLSRPLGLQKDEEGGEKMEVGWVDYDRNEKKKKEKKKQIKGGEKRKKPYNIWNRWKQKPTCR